MTNCDLAEKLPDVGDVRYETMTVSDRVDVQRPEKCVVVQVNKQRMWYCVQFERTGTKECYKLPLTNEV